ncbi:MAG: hypothetical protein ACOC80_03545 [Petrotogales bacterium]
MKQSSTKAKLYEFGKTIGLEASEIEQAKRTAKTIMSMCIMAGIFALIGIFSSRFGPVGLWYGGASINDFNPFGRFF